MRHKTVILLGFCAQLACGNAGLSVPAGNDGGVGGAVGFAGSGGAGYGGSGSGGGFVFNLPDGGLLGLLGGTGLSALLGDGGLSGLLGANGTPTLFGDGGLWAGIADASADSPIGQLLCAPGAQSGASCASNLPGCVLRSGGGACICEGGVYLCPTNTTAGPQACPSGVGSGAACDAPLTSCAGAGRVCICGLGTYLCD
jgi:hypothetical protein